MSRIRTIKPEFWTSEQVVECSPTARLMFIGFWNFADDNGVLPASAKQLKMLIFPGDDFTAMDVQGFVDELLAQGLLGEYEGNGRKYWAVTGWGHQKIEKPNFKYPKPPEKFADYSPTIRRPIADHSPTPRPRNGMEGNGEERKGREESPLRPPLAEIAATAPAPSPVTPAAPPDSLPIPTCSAIARTPKPKAASESAGTRLSGEWLLPPTWEQWALAAEPTWTVAHCRKVADSFRDYWVGRAGAQARKADWLATWRNWVRREGPMRATAAAAGGKAYATGRGGAAYVPAAVSAMQGNLAILAQFGMTAGDGDSCREILEGECSHA